MANILKLRYLGRDSWDRRVYQDEQGTLWKDVDCFNKPPLVHNTLYSSCGNSFDGEPDCPMSSGYDYEIVEGGDCE